MLSFDQETNINSPMFNEASANTEERRVSSSDPFQNGDNSIIAPSGAKATVVDDCFADPAQAPVASENPQEQDSLNSVSVAAEKGLSQEAEPTATAADNGAALGNESQPNTHHERPPIVDESHDMSGPPSPRTVERPMGFGLDPIQNQRQLMVGGLDPRSLLPPAFSDSKNFCKDFLAGHCARESKGQHCKFYHPPRWVKPFWDDVCKDFLNAGCSRGWDNCQFFHGTKEQLSYIRKQHQGLYGSLNYPFVSMPSSMQPQTTAQATVASTAAFAASPNVPQPFSHPQAMQPSPQGFVFAASQQPMMASHLNASQLNASQLSSSQLGASQLSAPQALMAQQQLHQQPFVMCVAPNQAMQQQHHAMNPQTMQPGHMQPGKMQPGQMQTAQMQTGQMQTGQMGQLQPGKMQPGQLQTGQMQGQLQTGQMGQMQSGQMQGQVQRQMQASHMQTGSMPSQTSMPHQQFGSQLQQHRTMQQPQPIANIPRRDNTGH